MSTAFVSATPFARERKIPLDSVLDLLSFVALSLFVASMPFEGRSVLAGFSADRWFGLATFSIAVLRIAATGRIRSTVYPHYLMAALAAWIAASVLWSFDPGNTIVRTGTYIQMLLMVWLVWELCRSERRILTLLQAYVAGLFATATYTLANFAAGTTTAKLSAQEGRYVWEEARYSIAGLNENDLGLMLAISVPIAIYLIVRMKNPFVRIFLWLHMGACFTAIFLTGSRGAIVSASVALLIVPLLFGRMPFSQKLMTGIAAVAVAALAIAFVPQETWERLLRLSSEITEGTMTHRTVIWAAGWGMFREHPFLGIGSGAYASAVYSIIDVPLIAHNTFLSILVELGTIGMLLYLVIILSLLYCVFRMKYLEFCLWFTILLTWSVGVSALAWEYRKTTWILWAILIAHAYSRRVVTIRRQRLEKTPIGKIDWQNVQVVREDPLRKISPMKPQSHR